MPTVRARVCKCECEISPLNMVKMLVQVQVSGSVTEFRALVERALQNPKPHTVDLHHLHNNIIQGTNEP